MPIMQHIENVLRFEMSSAGISLLRLVVAAVLGGLIGLERDDKSGGYVIHSPADAS